MMRSFGMVLWGIIAVFGFAGSVHADVVQEPVLPPGCVFLGGFPPPGELGIESCLINGSVENSNPNGDVTTGLGQVSIPQFDPALGSLIPGLTTISFSDANFSADATMTGTTAPDAPHAETFGFGFTPVLTASAGPLGSFSASGNPLFVDLFIGTGEVTFDVVETATDRISSGTFDRMSISANYQVLTTYGFTPAPVPEPSLLLVTAALFGLIVMVRKRCKLRGF